MKRNKLYRVVICFLLIVCIFTCTSCGAENTKVESNPLSDPTRYVISHFLVAVEDEPDTIDFQCTSIHYTIAQNVFNRLVEMENDANGNMVILPSLAKSGEISADGRSYTFHLQ